MLSSTEPSANAQATYDLSDRIVTAVSASGLTTYAFDLNGNLINVQEPGYYVTMAYDKENRLQSHARPGGLVATYMYDGDGLKRLDMEYGGIATTVWDGSDILQYMYVPNSTFVSQQVPLAMVHGQNTLVTLTFQNTGSYAWFGKWMFGIITQQPTDNTNWGPGTHQVRLTSDEITPVGATKVFAFNVAPPSAGTFTFQYQTFDAQGGAAFGATSTALSVVVS